MSEDIKDQQIKALALKRQGLTRSEIASRLGLSRDQVYRRINGALKAERLDPEIMRSLEAQGLSDLAGLHSGWVFKKNPATGQGGSLYFYLGPDEEKISFAEAIAEVLDDIPRLEPIVQLPFNAERAREDGSDYANWIALADLHVGGDYGDEQLEADFNKAIDDLVRRMPPAEHAVLIELGDLLEANDRKGVTPGSGNPLDVRRRDHLKNMQMATRLLRRAAYRLLETHATVDLHLIKGNHDPDAFLGVMIALAAHFENNPRMNVVVTDMEFRVITWGECAAFPHHGDTLSWGDLKDVWCDQYPDSWAYAKKHRHIMTAHFHHDRRRDLTGVTAEHYRTIHKANDWAKSRGLYSRGSLTAMTVHKSAGERWRTIANIHHPLEQDLVS